MILETLSATGLLLQQDKTALNVVTLLTGETLSGSWWSHPKGRLIFKVLSELADHPDVLMTKLLGGKVTLVHRKLWPALLAVAGDAQPWQMEGLSAPARKLLASVPVQAHGAAVKVLEQRLLVRSYEVHTDSGRHEMMLQSWADWAREARVKPLHSVAEARKKIEAATTKIGASLSALPWPLVRLMPASRT